MYNCVITLLWTCGALACRPPPRLFSAPLSSVQTQAGVKDAHSSSLTPGPSPLQVYSSVQPLEITGIQLTCREAPGENHTERFLLPGCEAMARRGNTLILKITISADLFCTYTVSLTLVPVFRPHERFGQFQAKGVARGVQELWLSITIPPNFPVGKYHTHVILSLRGGLQVLTHFHHKSLVVLFNPWNPGECV